MRKISIFILGILLFLFSTNKVFGYEKELTFYKDNFTSIDTSIWNVDDPNNNIVLSNGIILSSENSQFFPFLSSKVNIFPVNGDFYIKIKYQYLETTYFGVGFGFGNIIPTYGLTNYPFKDSDFIKFQVWQSLNDKSLIDTRLCNSADVCNENRTNVRLSLPDTNEHTLVIKNINGVTNVYYDDILTSSSPIINTNWRPTVFWIGNLIKLSTNNDWTDIKIFYIETGNIENIPDITKTIIIPGLGASWNMGAILTGKDEGEWSIPNFINNYDGLINSFKNAGYSDSGTDKNLFVFSYDWRRPLDVLADRLNDFINSNANGEKVNLVGHSMGGLVARAYAQKYGTTNVNKIVTVGSPNKGTLKAYGPWEGAVIFDDSWWSKVALELTTHFGVIAGESNIQTVHRVVPSLKDLLPTYDFLIFGNDSPLPISSENKNTYLENLNNNISGIDSLTTALFSDEIETDSLIKVISHSDGDLSTWIDGKPIENPFIKASGDGTVTDFSAKGLFSNLLTGTGWHGELVTKTDNIQKIFSVLGLDESKLIAGIDDSRDRVFVAALRSPGTLEVCNTVINKCNEELGYFDSINKIFLFPDYDGENLVVNVREDGIGDYKLHLGNIDDQAFWTEVNGKLKVEGQIDTYNVYSNNQILTASLVDEITPSTPIITGFKNPALPCGSITNSKFLTVDWSDSTDNYELAGYEYFVEYPLPNGIGRGVWNPSTLWSMSENYGSLNEGVHYIKVRAKDKAGNVSAWSNTCEITYDSIKPSFVSKTVFSSWYTTVQTSTFSYVDTNMRSDYVDPSCVISTEGTAQTCSISPNVCDLAGNCNTDIQISNGANIDMTPPRTPILFANDWGQRIWAGWMPVKGAIKYRIYYGTNKSELSNMVETRNSYWYSKILQQGKYFVRVSAVDKAGNESLKSNIETIKIKKHWWVWNR